jgi:lipopolysaccharide transport system ATP-binding protein
MSSEVVITVDGLAKAYQVYDRPQDRFMQMLLRGRKQYFNEFQALSDISFTIKKGETVGIIGKNGSGKSTLLQIICGTLLQSSGSVEVQGKIAALLELGAGFNPEFTGRENVNLYASILGLDEEAIARRFQSIVEFADIGEFLDQPVKTYSSGMVVRLAFAVVAHVDADILIIDEALAVGDAYFVQKCMRYLRRFSDNGTLLFVSHDTNSVVGLCDRAIWLENGEIKSIGAAKDVVGLYLEGLYTNEPVTDPGKVALIGARKRTAPSEYRDQRSVFINQSNLRNDIELFAFTESAAEFTDGQADIVDVEFLEDGNKLSWMVGGESVTLRVHCVSAIDLDSPIIGFLIKNRLGQYVFGDNTYLTYRERPKAVPAGQMCMASFEFTMPVLPVGDYSVDVSICNGTQEHFHVINWKYDVLLFRAQASSIVHGLVGIPMKSISLEIEDHAG